jgi:hypothetical protein
MQSLIPSVSFCNRCAEELRAPSLAYIAILETKLSSVDLAAAKEAFRAACLASGWVKAAPVGQKEAV